MATGNRQQAYCLLPVALILALIVLCFTNTANASPRQKLVVVVANRLLLSDLADPSLPTLSRMLRNGNTALISPNCAGPKAETSVLLTANAGTPCRGGAVVNDFYNANEFISTASTAGEAYQVRMGRKAPAGSAIFLGLGEALRTNAELNAGPVQLGALGDALHKAGVKTGIIGNADRLPKDFDRTAAALAMDSRGLIDYGGIHDSDYPGIKRNQWGMTLNSRALGDAAAYALRRTDYLVVYFGDSTVLDVTKPSMSDEAYALHKASTVRDLDHVLSALIKSPEAKHATFIIASFCPPSSGAWNQLTPFIIYPSRKPGLLTSPTTRTPGLIAASDFAPTVPGLMQVPTNGDMVGRPAEAVRSERPLDTLNDLATRVNVNQRLLTPMALCFAVISGIAFTGTALIIAFRLRASRRIRALLKVGLFICAAGPVAMLLGVLAPAGMFGYAGGTVAALVIVGILSFGIGAIYSRHRTIHALPIVIAYALSVIAILIDAFTGSHMCKTAGPSSYQISGMRFYGVGNEYAGLTISMAAMVALFSGSGRIRQLATVALGVVLLFMFGLGSLGANYGATISEIVTFGLLAISVTRGKFGARHVVGIFAVGAVTVAALAVVDLRVAGAQGTHAARAAGLTQRFGEGYLLSIAARKMLFNLKITVSRYGLRVIVGFVPFLGFWFWRIQGKLRAAYKQDPCILAGLKSVLIGSAVAFLLNDSGVVFAAMMIAMTVLLLLYSLLEEVQACPES